MLAAHPHPIVKKETKQGQNTPFGAVLEGAGSLATLTEDGTIPMPASKDFYSCVSCRIQCCSWIGIPQSALLMTDTTVVFSNLLVQMQPITAFKGTQEIIAA